MARSTGQARMVANLSDPLQHDLAVYALAASAAGVSVLSLSPPAEAEIVYTKAHQSIYSRQSYAIDLNHDGLPDFTIQNLYHTTTIQGVRYSTNLQLEAVPAAGGGVQMGFRSYLAAALPPGFEIGPSKPARFRPQIMAAQFNAYGTFYYFGSWQNVSNRYLGFHFKINGEWHYGWARLTVESNKKRRLVAVLTGYAYETEANKLITAGDTGSGSADGANSGPSGEMFPAPQPEAKPVMLGALALGARGLAIWRRPELESQECGN